MRLTDKYMIRQAIERAVLISVFLGGAWSLGFLLGFG
jgi:hypothetical protein